MKKKKIWSLLLLLMILINSVPATAYAANGTSYSYDGYTYDYYWNAVESPAAFQLERTIDKNNLEGTDVQGFNDVCTSKDGRIFLVDTLESRVNIVDQEGTYIKSLKVIRDTNNKIVVDEKGAQLVLKAPEGVFYYEKANELYIADTGAERIVVLDGTNYTLLRMIKKPDNMVGVTNFMPSKLVVDEAGRIYVVVQASYEGIIELNPDGSFSRYFGVNSPEVNLVDYFWKTISTDKQKEKMRKTFAPAFNNITLDSEGFIYAVTFDLSSKNMVFRLNAGGSNVLREKGYTKVKGNVYGRWLRGVSQFVDITVTDYGTYAVLDKNVGRIYIYDYDGQLLNVFGSLGNTKGSFQMPSGIAWLGDKLVVTDSTLQCAYILKPTDFGKTALMASEKYFYGKWDEALALNEQMLKMNSNYSMAYNGIGKNYLMKEDFKKAMYYFKLSENKSFYSKAFYGYRGEVLKKYFWIVGLVFLTLISLIIASEIKYHKKEGRKLEK